jgi:transcriptional regulator with GAF, ATPase, and Fis domain
MKAGFPTPNSVIERFVTLLDICQRINREKNFDDLLSLIASEAAKLVDAERATIFLLDAKAGEVWAKVALGTSEVLRFDARHGIAGAVIRGGKTIVVEDAYNSPLFYPEIDSQTGFRTRNILCVPIRNNRGEITGVFEVLNKQNGRFQSDDGQFVEALAAQAAVALENARQLMLLEQKQEELIEENRSLRKEVEERFAARNILGTSPRIDEIRQIIDKVAHSTVPVLVTGENGTGKELAARAIHYGGNRAAKRFVAVNCAALPESLVEAELFGIEKGVATGVERRVGRIESASGGTLFLDEIGDLSLTAQAKLLRVLQEREVEWVGGRRPVPVDIRLVAATNKDLGQEIEAGNFRQDLYFRLNTVHLNMPALREVRTDIALLAAHFLQEYRTLAEDGPRRFSSEAIEALSTYDWPGNIRELENEVKRAIVLASGESIQVDDLSDGIREGALLTGVARDEESPVPAGPGRGRQKLKERVATLETQMIRDALTQTDGDRRKAAKLLGLSHQGLINKVKRYGLA